MMLIPSVTIAFKLPRPISVTERHPYQERDESVSGVCKVVDTNMQVAFAYLEHSVANPGEDGECGGGSTTIHHQHRSIAAPHQLPCCPLIQHTTSVIVEAVDGASTCIARATECRTQLEAYHNRATMLLTNLFSRLQRENRPVDSLPQKDKEDITGVMQEIQRFAQAVDGIA